MTVRCAVVATISKALAEGKERINHMHILFDAPPQINLADFINAFKSASSRKIRQQFAEQLKPYFWSLSYFIGSVSEKTTSAVEHYIQHQKD
ncbi:MAG: IS200/IS605 family transposase [Solobacterium sp.]|nr:IS200/IS605 family transposase [Solobacterium sp.]